MFELVVEVLVDVGFRGTAKALRWTPVRLAIASAVGFGAGLWWGDHLSTIGLGHRPRLFWVTIVLGAVATLLAAQRHRVGVRREVSRPDRPRSLVPWRWPPWRLVGFGMLNFAIAGGISVGFQPDVLR